jgi:hypothetical protein
MFGELVRALRLVNTCFRDARRCLLQPSVL